MASGQTKQVFNFHLKQCHRIIYNFHLGPMTPKDLIILFLVLKCAHSRLMLITSIVYYQRDAQ